MSGFLQYAAVAGLLCLSGLFSGLNLGLMSLDQVGLELTVRTGSASEARWARAILPIRRTGNFLLCTLLLGNTAVNAMLAIFLGDMTGGLVGGIVSTLGIVIVGEIIPQSICSRYGLAVGYYTRFMVLLFMVVMAPLAYPTAKLLDCVLGEELAQLFSAKQLRQLVHLNSESGGHGGELSDFEAKLLMGALRLEERHVREVMITFEEAPVVSPSAPLDPQLLHRLFHSPHVCVPVLEEDDGGKRRVLDFLNVKDAIFYASLPSRHLTVGDIICWYDTSNILHLDASEPMHKAYQKFAPTHRLYAVVMDGGAPVGFACQEDLMRGWAIQHQRREDDAARFDTQTMRMNKAVKSLALTWKYRTRERTCKLSPRKSVNAVITKISPECRTQLAALVPSGPSHDAIVQRKVLFTIYLLLARQTEAFRPGVISAARASKLLSLPRAFFREETGTAIVGPGAAHECTVVFEGSVSVHREGADPQDAPEGVDSGGSAPPARIFNADALLSDGARSDVWVSAESPCSVLRISRADYLAYRVGALDDREGSLTFGTPSGGGSGEFVLPNSVV